MYAYLCTYVILRVWASPFKHSPVRKDLPPTWPKQWLEIWKCRV